MRSEDIPFPIGHLYYSTRENGSALVDDTIVLHGSALVDNTGCMGATNRTGSSQWRSSLAGWVTRRASVSPGNLRAAVHQLLNGDENNYCESTSGGGEGSSLELTTSG